MGIFVNFFAAWCGHCQRLKPKFRELSAALAHVKTLEFAQIDSTRNDIGVLEDYVMAYPTLLLFPAGRKESQFREYMGRRTVDDMSKWLHLHATHNFSISPPPED